MLIRVIIFIALAALCISLYRKWQAANARKRADARAAATMRKCAHCGVHLPEPDAIKSGEHYFCSDQHRIAYDEQHRND